MTNDSESLTRQKVNTSISITIFGINNLALNIGEVLNLDLILYYFVYNDHWSQQLSPLFSGFSQTKLEVV